MDNDEDFQSQNFQLLAEDNNKFPSSLRLFSLPKFELDDHLQFHLRFDGLVEQEPLLGIQHQEQTNWIEEFTPGNDALELSSSAAESCSIPRQKNVWSEATSSESVEMLLKSVGEDDMMNKSVNVIHSESPSGLNSVTDHMHPCCSQDDSLQSEEDKAIDADPVRLPGQHNKALSSFDEDWSSVSPDLPDMPNTLNDEGSGSRIFEALDEISKSEKASNPRKAVTELCGLNESLTTHTMELSAIREKSFDNSCSETTNGGNLYDDTMKTNESNDYAASASLMAEESQNASAVPIDRLTSSFNLIANDSDGSSSHKLDEHASEGYGEEVFHVKSQNLMEDTAHEKETRSSGLEMQPSERCTIENSPYSPENSSSSKPKAESLTSSMKGYNVHVASEKACLSDNVAYQLNMSNRGSGIGDQMTIPYEKPLLVTENQTNLDGHSIEIPIADNIRQSMMFDPLEQAKEVISDASVESNVSLKDHHVHDESLMSVKNTKVVGDCEGREPEEPSIPTEEEKDVCSHLTENTNLVELCALNNTNNGMQETDKKEDNNLGIHPAGLTPQGPESSGIQRSAGNEVLENDRSMLGDIVNGLRENVGEVTQAPGPCVELCRKASLSPSLDGRSLERYDTIIELDGWSSDVQNIPSISKKHCTISPASSESMNPHMDVERLQDAVAQSQSECTCILEVHEERAPAGVTTQVESGDAVNFKGTSLQLVSSQSCTSEPCSVKDGDGDPSSSVTCCVSPVVVNCIEPSSDELHQQLLKKGLSDQCDRQSGNLLQVSSFSRSPKENKSTAGDIKETSASVEDRSFVFEVGSIPDTAEREAAEQQKPSANMEPYEILQDRERCSTKSGSRQANLNVLRETPGELHASGEVARKSSQKSKTVSRSVSERRTASKRKSVKETLVVKQADERDENPGSKPLNTVGNMRRTMQVEQLKQNSHEGGSVKPSCSSSVQTSKLPVLETAVALVHQPFTDKQQVQLRAQIFVYGSLIQGVPPDEACMMSAFENSDGGRSAWEGVWHVAREKFLSHKSPTINLATPSHYHSGVRFLEKISMSSPLQSKTHGISVSSTSQGARPVTFNSPTSLPSPLCNVSTCRDALHSNVSEGPHLDSSEIFSPSHTSHSSHGKKYAGNGNPWVSQASLPLVASSQPSILGARSHISVLPVAETSHVTPMRNSSVPYISNIQPTMSSSFTTAGVLSTLSAATAVQIEPMKKAEPSRPEKHATSNQKTRRKKCVASEMPAQLLPHSHPHAEIDSTTAVIKRPPPLIGYALPAASPVVPSIDFQVKDGHGNEQKVVEEACGKTVQAMFQAEDAAVVAAAAVRHSEGIWSQLSTQKNFGLVSETDMKLAYAAVAAAAASSVAKAAAAAAMVASDAALRAKMMADEALSSGAEISIQHSETSNVDGGTNFPGVTSILILKGKEKTDNSHSVISAAKEAARRRVEAASAAAKRAENLDAIVKAAELAAVAVSQAGAIISMGDPLPFALSDLMEAGPEGCRKVEQSTAVMHKEKQMALACADDLSKSVPQLCSAPLNEEQRQQIGNEEGKSSSADGLKESTENLTGTVAVHSPDISTLESEKDQIVVHLKENSIQEGSLVEVLSNRSGLRRVWYSATVLSLKDGKAYVSYNERSNSGFNKLKEWIPLEDECDKPPRIRIAHPTIAVKYEGTRKRRRAAMVNYVWAVGDRVDAWTHDGWCEGIVTEISKDDETRLSVHFPAGGDASDFRVWHLRPSLVWKDGQWIEWSRPRGNVLHPREGDTPQDKRQKLIRFEENVNAIVNIGANKHSADIQTEDSQKPPEESEPLVLSQKDKVFSLGKSVREESNSDTLRVKRTGLQKEGSKVIFGIPKPGKRRKFMEVSKHYVGEKPETATEGSDSIKFAKYLVPQSSRVWKNTKSDPKGRQGGEPKPKLVRSIKPSESMHTRSTTEKEGSFLSSVSTSSVGTSNCEENQEKSLLETMSISNNFEVEGNQASVSPQCPLPGITSSKKKTFDIGSDVGVKGKVAPFADHPGKRIPGAVEPRRSNRRFQPTSRLLEGLQSSMVVAKNPSLLHEKGSRISHRNAPSSGGDVHG